MYKIDETDVKIIEILKKDGRCSYSEIAEKVHLSRVAVRERIMAMQENGVIVGFTVQISSKAINKEISVFFDIEVEPNELSNIAKQLALLDDVAIVSQHTGTTGLHVHAFLDTIENLAHFMDKNFYSIYGVKSVQSHILIKNYKTNAFLG
jgi:Lrp/AsnC family transcriptional regulator, leucine-responsive regulatory protein